MIDIDDPHDEVRYNRPVDFDETKIWDDEDWDEIGWTLTFFGWVVVAGAFTIGALAALVVFL